MNIFNNDISYIIWYVFFIYWERKNFLFFIISNLLITPFLLLLFVSIFVFVAKIGSKIGFTIITLLITLILCLGSLLARPLTNTKMVSENNNSSLIKVCDKDQEFYLSNTNFINQYNNIPDYVYASPFEWFLTFYSSLYVDLINNESSFQKQMFSLDNSKLIKIDIPTINSNESVVLRPQDINFTKLNNYQHVKLVANNVDSILKNNSWFNWKNKNVVDSLILKLSSNLDWSTSLNDNELKIVKELTGINQEYNQLFYLIKYNDLLSLKLNLIFDEIKTIFNNFLLELVRFVWTSKQTQINLFINNNVLNTNKNITELYPDLKIVNTSKPILNVDINFIKNDLIRFAPNNNVFYLNNKKYYQQISNDVLNNIPELANKASWDTYIDNNSVSYKQTNNILIKLRENFSDLYNFSLSKNYVDINTYSYFMKLVPTSNLQYSAIFITLITIINVGLIPLTWSSYKKMQYLV